MAVPSAQSILFLTKYSRNGASSRYRSLQYLPYLEQQGLHCEVSPLFDEAYLIHKNGLGYAWKRDIVSAFFRRLFALLSVRRFNLVVLEYEFLPYFPAWPERLLKLWGIPYVVDYDDALFHQYDLHPQAWVRRILASKISQVMSNAAMVTVGNEYLANYAHTAGAIKVEVIPTVIDLNRYFISEESAIENDVFTIGWIGSPSTANYLEGIASALAEVCDEGGVRVRLIGSGPVDLPGVPLDVVPWTEASEVNEISRFDVGIMPLTDTPWERGKCGFKLIQYMACGLPVVASPVGVNKEIVKEGVNGYLASDLVSWVSALRNLRDDANLRRSMGLAGREAVEQTYCLQVTAPHLSRLLLSVT